MKAAMLVDRLFWLEVQGLQMDMVCIPAASEAKQDDPSKSSSEKQNKMNRNEHMFRGTGDERGQQ